MILKQLQDARCDLQKKELKKSGKNKYSNYNYFELSDFLPAINECMKNHNISSSTKINNDQAELIVYNSEDINDKLIFTCPVSVPEMKGANSIQAIGAMITYVRRYLWMMVFEIVEHDIIDSQAFNTEEKPIKNNDINNKAKSEKALELRNLAKPVAKLLDKKVYERLAELAKDDGASLTADEYQDIKIAIKTTIAEMKLDEATGGE